MGAQIGVGVDTRSRRRAVAAAVIGNFIEWYDFSVYAFFATVVAPLFFPSDNPTASLLAAFAAFGVAFVVRPVGGVIFGHYGDKIGRRNTLALVVLIMAGATTLIGVLPSYAQIGIVAPIFLIIARALRGHLHAGNRQGRLAMTKQGSAQWRSLTWQSGSLMGFAVLWRMERLL